MFREQQFDTGEVKLNFAEGPAAGPALVLLHGATLSWRTHQALLPGLSKHWHVLAVDLRGHGASGRTPGRYGLMDYAGDLVRLIRQYLLTPAVIYGHSLGALVAIAVAAQAVEAVHGLVLADPPLFYRDTRVTETKWGNGFAQTHAALEGSPESELIAERLAEAEPGADRAALDIRAERLRQLDPGTLAALLAHSHMAGYHMGPLLARVACPTLLIQCDLARGAALEDDDAEFARAHLRHGLFVRLPGVGHMLHTAQPETVLRLLDEFRRRVSEDRYL
jgi:pimeloyl-ACP methyl ester carboxylesterase